MRAGSMRAAAPWRRTAPSPRRRPARRAHHQLRFDGDALERTLRMLDSGAQQATGGPADRIEQARKSGGKKLDLESCGLTKVPKEIWSIPGLEEIDLTYNELRTIPTSLRNLTRFIVAAHHLIASEELV